MQAANENLPPDLLSQMEKPKDKIKKDAHTLALVYIDECGPSTIDELLVYIWKLTGKVKSRDYMHHVMLRLRNRGHIERMDLEEPVLRHMLTLEGERYVKDEGLTYFKLGEKK